MLRCAGLDDATNAGIVQSKKALRAADVQFQLYIYGEVNQGFNDNTAADRYNGAAADLAWLAPWYS